MMRASELAAKAPDAWPNATMLIFRANFIAGIDTQPAAHWPLPHLPHLRFSMSEWHIGDRRSGNMQMKLMLPRR